MYVYIYILKKKKKQKQPYWSQPYCSQLTISKANRKCPDKVTL